jgi:hypothetical protein
MFGIGLPEIALLLYSLANIAVGVWAIMDAASWPEAHWVDARRSKGLWLTILTLSVIVGCFSFAWVVALFYVLLARRALVRNR